MKKVTVTHDVEITAIDEFEDWEIDYMMKNQKEYLRGFETVLKSALDVDDLHISNFKIFVHDEAGVQND